MSKYGLDKFYTKKEIVEKCITTIKNLDDFDLIIDPSAGKGAFSDLLPSCLALDIEPDKDTIIQQDFLSFIPPEENSILVIGNPPFGRQNNLVRLFIKKSCEFANTIAFILPKSFKKESLKKTFNENFHLIFQMDLPPNSFIFNNEDKDVPCVWQIWEKKDFPRETPKPLNEKEWFKFVRKEEGDIAIRRVGIYAGKASEDLNKAEQSHYFIKTNKSKNDLINFLNSICWKHENTVGPRSLSKQEILKEIEKFC